MKKIIYLLSVSILFWFDFVSAQDFSPKTLQENAASKLNPGNIKNVSNLLSVGINAMLVFMGSIALALVVYAGFLWMTAGGNESKIEKARTIVVWTLLGTLAIGASYGFISFVISIFG